MWSVRSFFGVLFLRHFEYVYLRLVLNMCIKLIVENFALTIITKKLKLSTHTTTPDDDHEMAESAWDTNMGQFLFHLDPDTR